MNEVARSKSYGVVLASVIIYLIALIPLCYHAWREYFHAKVTSTMQDLQLGMSQSEVIAIAKNIGWDNGGIVSGDNPDTIMLATPTDWGGNNWIIVCTFEEGALISAYVGTADSLYYKPESAPGDIGSDVLDRNWQ